MVKLIHRVTTVVRQIEQLGGNVRAFELADPDDWDLPPYTAGAHIDVHLQSGRVRQYSLYGDPAERTRYRIAVQREDCGRGGSTELHETFKVGAVVPVSLPRNHFALAEAPHHVMIAGGIGITPFLSMLATLETTDLSFELHYCSRSPSATPFLDQVARLSAQGKVHHHFSRGGRRLDVSHLLSHIPLDTHVYCCGPGSLIEAVVAAAKAAGCDERVHLEFFSSAGAEDGAEYEIELVRSGRIIPVGKGVTMLQALRSAGVELESSCEGGVCLECKTRYLAGSPIHRDLVMQAEDRREFITPCVSGCATDKLFLDL